MADRYDYDRDREHEREHAYDRDRHRARDDERWQRNRDDRGLMDRATDDVKSWFGDEDAARRRHRDDLRDESERGFGRGYERTFDRDYDREFSRGYTPSRERGYAVGEDVSRSGTSSRSDWTSSSRDFGRSDWGSQHDRSRNPEGYRGRSQESAWRDRGESIVPYAYSSYSAWSYSEPGPFTGRGPRGYQRSDDRIREDICDRLTRHGRVDATDITVSVTNGEVTLEGMVDTRDAKRIAEDIVESVDGVRDVNNHLKTYRVGFKERSGQHGKGTTQPDDTGSITGTTAVGSLDKKR